MEEMVEDTLDMDEDEELEEEADAEVDKVLFDLTDGKLGLAGSVSTELPVRIRDVNGTILMSQLQTAQEQLEDEETERTMANYRAQLSGLLS